MFVFTRRWLVALSAGCLISGAAVSQDGLRTDSSPVETSVPPDGVAEQMRLDQMAMQQVMKSQEMMKEAKEDLMSDKELASRVAREILMQEMVKDKQYLAMVRKGLRTEDKDDPKMKVLVDKISAAKAEMLKDKDAMMSMTRELMVRQIAANRIAMMNGGRFPAEKVKQMDEKKLQNR